jgi:hypothetical protein
LFILPCTLSPEPYTILGYHPSLLPFALSREPFFYKVVFSLLVFIAALLRFIYFSSKKYISPLAMSRQPFACYLLIYIFMGVLSPMSVL